MKRYFTAIHLYFPTGLHLSRGREEVTISRHTVSADMLKSALFSAAIRLFGDGVITPQFLDAFQLSSGFPFMENLRFFPRPFLSAPIQFTTSRGAAVDRKRGRKIRWLEKSLFEDLVQGKKLLLDDEQVSADGQFVTPQGKMPHGAFQEKTIRQKVSLRNVEHGDTASEAHPSTPYFLEEIRFGEQSGLYFLIEMNPSNEVVKNQIFSALRLLADEGLGSARSRGIGQFSWESHDCSLEVPASGHKWMALGNAIPTKSEMEQVADLESGWELVLREGFASAAYDVRVRNRRRLSLYMFTAGSVLHLPQPPVGKLVDLNPAGRYAMPHPIWRDGRPIWIPLQLTQSHDDE